AALYNMVPNLLWSALALAPVSVFCYTHLTPRLLFLFVVFSVFPLFLPNSFLHRWRVAGSKIVYKKLGIGIVQRLSQDGEMVNAWMRRKYPNYKAVRPDQQSVRRLLRQTYVFEKFHIAMLLFFCLLSFYALSEGLFTWSAVVFLLNI